MEWYICFLLGGGATNIDGSESLCGTFWATAEFAVVTACWGVTVSAGVTGTDVVAMLLRGMELDDSWKWVSELVVGVGVTLTAGIGIDGGVFVLLMSFINGTGMVGWGRDFKTGAGCVWIRNKCTSLTWRVIFWSISNGFPPRDLFREQWDQ